MAVRTVSYEVDFDLHELAERLKRAGFRNNSTIADLLSAPDYKLRTMVRVPEDDLVSEAASGVLVAELRDRGDFDRDERSDRDVEDTLRYVRQGDVSLARMMIDRVFIGDELRAAERALS